MSKGKASLSDFYCTECGSRGIPIMRKAGQSREPGHLKKLFCLKCKKETNHVEVRPYGNYRYENFLEEYSLGRFFEGKRIPVSGLNGCSKHDCLYNKNGRCWNSNYSHKCAHRPLKTIEDIRELFKDVESK